MRVSAICEGCFLEGEHKKHDYVMYHSDSGGCCDCGDLETWKFDGFCSAHRCVDRQDPSVPSELELPSKESETNGEPPVSREKLIETAIIFLDWLKQLCSVDALRKIVCWEVVQTTLRDRETLEVKSPLHVLLKTFASMPEEILQGFDRSVGD